MKVSFSICNYLFSSCFISMMASIGVAVVFFGAAPVFFTMFKSFGGELPWLTQFMLNNYPFILLLPLTALLLCSVSQLRTKQFLPSTVRSGKIGWIMLWMLIIFAILLGAFAMYLPIFRMCSGVV